MIGAWVPAGAHTTRDDVRRCLDQIPRLVPVLYPRDYVLADEYPAVAYAPSGDFARVAREYPFVGVIGGRDEPNVPNRYKGPSGPYLPPTVSRAQFIDVDDTLGQHPAWRVPAALSPPYAWWRYLLFCARFDDAYHRERGVASVAWTPSRVRMRELQRVRREYGGHQVIAPAPYLGPNRWFQVSPQAYCSLANDTTHVLFWSLRSIPTQVGKHGLFHPDNRPTRIGRAVRDALA